MSNITLRDVVLDLYESLEICVKAGDIDSYQIVDAKQASYGDAYIIIAHCKNPNVVFHSLIGLFKPWWIKITQLDNGLTRFRLTLDNRDEVGISQSKYEAWLEAEKDENGLRTIHYSLGPKASTLSTEELYKELNSLNEALEKGNYEVVEFEDDI